jgi:hypothetical protein
MYLHCDYYGHHSVASRPRFGGDSQAHSWYRPAGVRPSLVGTIWKGSAGQGSALSGKTGTRPKGYQVITQLENKQCFHNHYMRTRLLCSSVLCSHTVSMLANV